MFSPHPSELPGSGQSSPVPRITRIDVSGPAEFLGALPYMMGHHPQAGDLIVAGLRRRKVVALSRADLADSPVQTATRMIAPLHAVSEIDDVIIAGYAASTSEAAICEAALTVQAAGFSLASVLRVDNGRIWCVTCDCLGPDGIPFDPSATVAAATATLAGLVAVGSRAELLAQVAHDADAAEGVSDALDVVCERLLEDPPDDDAAIAQIDEILAVAATGRRIDDVAAATLLLLFMDTGWRTHAWLATDDQTWIADLWCDLTRRTPRHEAFAAPAALAGWSAWRCGNALLARAAVDIALDLDPQYRMAVLLADVLDASMSPSALTWPPSQTDRGTVDEQGAGR